MQIEKLLQQIVNLLLKILGVLSPSDDPEDGSDVVDDPIDVVIEDEEPPVVIEPPVRRPSFMWCLDPGHGAMTDGKRSPMLNGRILKEYEFNREIVKGVAEVLEVEGIQYFITVPEVNVGNFLTERVRRANNLETDLPKIFLSIHSNAGPADSWDDYTHPTAKGLEVWFYHGSQTGKTLASIFLKFLVNKLGWRNRGIKSKADAQFYVLKNTRMPAILTENGFYNNREQLEELFKPEVKQAIIDAHITAIKYIEANGI